MCRTFAHIFYFILCVWSSRKWFDLNSYIIFVIYLHIYTWGVYSICSWCFLPLNETWSWQWWFFLYSFRCWSVLTLNKSRCIGPSRSCKIFRARFIYTISVFLTFLIKGDALHWSKTMTKKTQQLIFKPFVLEEHFF